MKRIAIKLVVFLLLGAVVNVAVALACAFWSDVQALGRHEDHEPRLTARVSELWEDFHPPDFPDKPSWTTSLVGPGVRDVIAFRTGWSGDDESFRKWRLIVRELGWPMRSMQALAWYSPDPERISTIGDWLRLSSTEPDHHSRSVVVSAEQIPFLSATHENAIRLIPLYPSWPAFMVNTVMYAIAWWVLLGVVGNVKRRLHVNFKHTVVTSVAVLTMAAFINIAVAGLCFHFRDPLFVQGWCEACHSRAGLSVPCFGRTESFGVTETVAFGPFDKAHPPANDMLGLSYTDDVAHHLTGEVVQAFRLRSAKPVQTKRTTLETWVIEAEIEIGWPYRCLWGVQRLEDDKGATGQLIGAIELNNDSSIVLPITPTSGFILNTLFYTVLLWLAWSTLFATVRLIRKRRGRCVRCGYDLRHAEHEVCPECGNAVKGDVSDEVDVTSSRIA